MKNNNIFWLKIMPALWGFIICFCLFGLLQSQSYSFPVKIIITLIVIIGLVSEYYEVNGKDGNCIITQFGFSVVGAIVYFMFYSYFLKIALLIEPICVFGPFLLHFIMGMIFRIQNKE